jgi:hypothetical protein
MFRQGLEQIANNPGLNPYQRLGAQIQSAEFQRDAWVAARTARQMGPEVVAAYNDLVASQQKLAQIRNQEPKPQWPNRFEPVDPNDDESLTAPPKPAPATRPATPAAAAAAPVPPKSTATPAR